MNWANRITLLRIILVPFFIGSLIYGEVNRALWIFLAAAVTDALDGVIARLFHQRTKLGSFLDPLADKLLITTAFIGISMTPGLPVQLPPWVAILVISRDIIIILGATTIFMNRGKLEIFPSRLGKLTTTLQMFTILAVLVGFIWVEYLWLTMSLVTFLSGWDYILRGMKILQEAS